jgi:pSer/pThr/pTyr-binding forkhead associated (FHA) protein
MLSLILKRPGRQDEVFAISDKNTYIGRVPVVNEIQIDHPSLSRQHARIKRLKKGYAIYDLDSTNGTFINGREIEEGELHDGDELRLGEISVTVQIREDAARPRKNPVHPLKDLDRLQEKMAVDTLADRRSIKKGK